MASRKQYDLILADARQERDESKEEADRLRAERALFLTHAEFGKLLLESGKKEKDKDG